jgi:uncharacterized protein YcbK (DUF882 family)
MKLTRNFSLAEFACRDGTPVPPELRANVRTLADQLQVIRDFFDAPVTIRSGYRTPAYNRSIGGAKNSKHLTADAADIVVAGYTAAEVQRAVAGLMRIGAVVDGGLGSYRTFTHVDIGPRRRWNG